MTATAKIEARQERQTSLAAPTFEQIEAALDAGKLEMIRPQGDWVPVRRRGNTGRMNAVFHIPVFMENQVEASISTLDANTGFFGVRIVGHP